MLSIVFIDALLRLAEEEVLNLREMEEFLETQTIPGTIDLVPASHILSANPQKLSEYC